MSDQNKPIHPINQPITLEFTAGADLRLKQHFMMKISAAGTVITCDTPTLAMGVLQNTPNTNEKAFVVVCGSTQVINAGGLAVGLPFGCDTNGKAVAADATHPVVGFLNEASTGADDVVESIVGIGTGLNA